jgi:hypothetical protein
MARYFTSFDGNRPQVVDGGNTFDLLPTYDQLMMLGTSQERTNLRDGLISSRSALAEDVYEELDFPNRDGGKGIYFPPDTFITASTIYTASAYTSSVPGIVIPPPNLGAFRALDFEVRPTASILSNSSLVTPTVPLDSASFSSILYFSASQAASRVLSLNTSVIGQGGIYVTPGNFPDRTFHSAWHDPDVTFFAWDTFTPGTPDLNVTPAFFQISRSLCTTTTPNPPPNENDPIPNILTINGYTLRYGKEFRNDFNTAGGRIQFQVTWSAIYPNQTLSENVFRTITFNVSGSNPVLLASDPTSSYKVDENINLEYGNDQGASLFLNYQIRATASFFDANITTSRGPFAYAYLEDNVNCGNL